MPRFFSWHEVSYLPSSFPLLNRCRADLDFFCGFSHGQTLILQCLRFPEFFNRTSYPKPNRFPVSDPSFAAIAASEALLLLAVDQDCAQRLSIASVAGIIRALLVPNADLMMLIE